MLEVERMCNQIVFLHHGRVIAAGSPIDITRAIMKEERTEPALEEVFLRVVQQQEGTA
jgi:ABC-type Na+ transport system ATPase subunit NatA